MVSLVIGKVSALVLLAFLLACSSAPSDSGNVAVDPVAETPTEVTLSQYSSPSSETDRTLSSEQAVALVDAHNALATSLFQRGCFQTDQNCVTAPNAIARNLSMLALGAEGNARAKLDEILGLGTILDATADSYALLDVTDTSGMVPSLVTGTFAVNASFWGQEQVLFGTHFLDHMTGQFLAELHETDFEQTAAMGAIKDWQTAMTEGFVFGHADLDAETQLVITNTDYLSSAWPTSTGTANEISGTFQQSLLVPFDQLDGVFDVFQTAEYDAFRLSLAAGKEILFVMPTSGLFGQVVSGLNPSWVSSILAGMTPQSITLFVPKFQTQNSIDLKQYLTDGGAVEVFDPVSGSFSAISREASFYPNVLVHNAKISISVQGVKTGSLNLVSFKKPVPPDSTTGFILTQNTITTCPTWNLAQNEFVLDQPFLFLIRDSRTGALLYLGQFHGPDDPTPICGQPPVEFEPPTVGP